jgi:cytochrome c-type biogenesis protein CcmE
MLQKKAKKRASLLAAIFLISLLAIFLVVKSLEKNILYFKSPTDIKESQDLDFNKKLRVGGMVKKDSIIISEEEIKFIITDLKNELKISYSGTVPNLFLEEKGVVAEGKLKDKSFFIANRILAKHDENYMPPELKNIMKKNVK